MSNLFSDLPAMLPPPAPDFPENSPSFVRQKVVKWRIEQVMLTPAIIIPDEHQANLARMAEWKANAVKRAEEAARRAEEAARLAAIEAAEAEAAAKALAERKEAEEEVGRISTAAASRRKPRRCLCCSKTFPSHGPGNRMCSDCRYQAGLSGFTEFSTSISF